MSDRATIQRELSHRSKIKINNVDETSTVRLQINRLVLIQFASYDQVQQLKPQTMAEKNNQLNIFAFFSFLTFFELIHLLSTVNLSEKGQNFSNKNYSLGRKIMNSNYH